MRQHYQREDLDRLLSFIKSETAAIKAEDHEKFLAAERATFADLCDVFRRAAETTQWALEKTTSYSDFQEGSVGEWRYWISGRRYGHEIGIYKPHKEVEVQIQPYEDGYKMMMCYTNEAAFITRPQLIKSIAYLLQTEKQDPSVEWIPDPEVFGWPKEDQEQAAQGWW